MTLRICCYFHMYPPKHMAGSETTVHAVMRAMALRGHDVKVIADRTLEPYQHEGVSVLNVPRNNNEGAYVRELAKDADLLVTHLDLTSQAMHLAVDLQKPLVHFIHNHAQLAYWKTPPHKAQLVVFNTEWIAKEEKYKGEPWPGYSIVLHPIIEPEKYRCEKGTKITLCNPTEGKGIHTLHKLAESMPDFEFLVVEGIYGEQIAPPNLPDEWVRAHPNIEHMKNSPDFRDVLRKTKVLLMPSGYESYGRCAVEATCAGIPPIVHPTQGLWEALGDGRYYPAETEYGVAGTAVIAKETFESGVFDGGMINGAGIFCLRDDIPAWTAQIERLYSDEVYYRSRSDAALKLAASFDPEKDFDRLEAAFFKTVSDWQRKDEVDKPMLYTSTQRYWETSDGSWVAERNGRIPSDAIRLAVGIGTEITEEVARAKGILPPLETDESEAKSIEAPDENKAISAPQENKAKKPRKAKVA